MSRYNTYAAALAFLAMVPASEALADEPERDTCIKAYVDAQAARKDGALLRAERGLELCSHETCPGMIVRDCAQWLEEVHRALPTVVLAARDDQQRDLLDVTAYVDGVKTPNDGKPLTLDPGRHSLRFERPGAPAQEQVVMLAEGEHERHVLAVFSKRPSVTALDHGGGTPTGTWVLGSIGVASLAVFGVVAAVGASDRTSSGCDRGCSESSYARVNGELNAANVALGVGVASLAGALIWFLVEKPHGADPQRAQVPFAGTF